jgi:hypothetical protein
MFSHQNNSLDSFSFSIVNQQHIIPKENVCPSKQLTSGYILLCLVYQQHVLPKRKCLSIKTTPFLIHFSILSLPTACAPKNKMFVHQNNNLLDIFDFA